jgi:hypothetical protein
MDARVELANAKSKIAVSLSFQMRNLAIWARPLFIINGLIPKYMLLLHLSFQNFISPCILKVKSPSVPNNTRTTTQGNKLQGCILAKKLSNFKKWHC